MKLITMTITPQIASLWLETNVGNRNVNTKKVEEYAQEMRKGTWQLNGETIKIGNQRLIDGQHRLMACVAANASFVSAVAHVSNDVFTTVDIGIGRTPGQIAQIAGIPNSNAVMASIKKSLLYKASIGQLTVNESYLDEYLTKKKLVELYQSDEQTWLKAVAMGDSVYRNIGVLNRSNLIACAYIFLKADPAKAQEFFTKLASGEGMVKDHPCLTLRNDATRRAHMKLSDAWWHECVRIVHAWNAFISRRLLKNIKHNAKHPVPDYLA